MHHATSVDTVSCT